MINLRLLAELSRKICFDLYDDKPIEDLVTALDESYTEEGLEYVYALNYNLDTKEVLYERISFDLLGGDNLNEFYELVFENHNGNVKLYISGDIEGDYVLALVVRK